MCEYWHKIRHLMTIPARSLMAGYHMKAMER